MIILGIDPGIATVGFGVITADKNNQTMISCGTIGTKAGVPLASRLLDISNDVSALIERFRPDSMAIEELFFNTNAKTAISVAHGRGVILLTAERCGIPIFEYTPLQVKQAVVGYGRAEKKQVMEMTRRLLNMREVPKPDDAADALAIAISHGRSATSRLNINVR